MKFGAILTCLFALGLAPKALGAQLVTTSIEVTGPITSTSFSGTLDDGSGGVINTTWTVGGGNLSFIPNRFITNNSYQLFDDPTFTPPTSNVDRIATFFTGGPVGATDTLNISFDQALTNPVISFLNVDHTNWELLNPGSSISLLSQNGGVDSGLIASNIIQDNTLNNSTGPADSLDIVSGSGSFQINGTFTELNFLNTRVSGRPGTQIDGQQYQILSFERPLQSIPEPSTVLGTTACLFASAYGMRRRKLAKKSQ